MQSLLDQKSRNQVAPTTAKIEHGAAVGYFFGERVDPDPIIPAGAPAGRVPLCRTTSIKADDGFRKRDGHWEFIL
jgi:hypothetical protein